MLNWLSFENLKWLIGTLAVPVALGYVSSNYERAQTERQTNEARLRLYTELLSKREEADTSVRKGIFDKVLETYLKPGSQDLGAKLVALELLALNFNESLDLSPLFWQLAQQIEAEPAKRRAELAKQLQRIARDVKERQIALLEAVGTKRDASLELDELATAGPVIDADLNFPDLDPFAPEGRQVKRHFKVEVAEHDPANRRAWVRVSSNESQWAFWVDTFDFPLVNFTRISKSERFAVVLKRYDPPSAQLTFVYFPSSRSGVKDRPFIDEVISNLVHQPR
jgi:hypothetical protein